MHTFLVAYREHPSRLDVDTRVPAGGAHMGTGSGARMGTDGPGRRIAPDSAEREGLLLPLQDAFATESGVTDFHRILYNGETMNFEQFNNEHRYCMDFLREACSSAQAPRNTSETERGSLNLITHCIQTTGQKSRMNHHSAVKTTE